MQNGARRVLGVAMVAMAGASPVWAQTPANQGVVVTGPTGMPGQPGPVGQQTRVLVEGPASPLMMLLRSAQLSPAQQAQIQQILQSSSAEAIPLTQQMRAAQEQMAAKLLGAGAVTAADLAPLQQQVTGIRQQLDQHMIDTSLAIRNVLTADQLSQLASVHQKLESLRTQIEQLIGPGPGGMVMLPPG